MSLPDPSDEAYLSRTFDTVIRIGVFLLLVAWCFQIVRPFLTPIAWGVILAVIGYPAYRWLGGALGERHKLAATLLAFGVFVMLIGPTVLLGGTLVEFTQGLVRSLESGTFEIPPPPSGVADWPLIGEPLAGFWALASTNLEAALEPLKPYLLRSLRLLLATAAGTAVGIFQFVIAIVIAGFLLTQSDRAPDLAYPLGRRLGGERGPELIDLARATLGSVAQGILGVALIQAVLAGIGFLAIGVPGAGLWALLCLILCVVQVGPTPILIPIAIYVFFTSTTVPAVLFLIWSAFVGLIDNVLKPLLLGRGLEIPMLVIFLGAIGGFLASGIIGLFEGAVVLAISYTLVMGWLGQPEASGEAEEVA